MATATPVTISSYADWNRVGMLRPAEMLPARHGVDLYSAFGGWVGTVPIYEAEIVLGLNTWDVLRLTTDAKYVRKDSDQRLVVYRAGIGQRHGGRMNVFLAQEVEYDQNLAHVTAFCGTCLLDHAIVDYAAASSEASKSGAADAVMKEIVDENLVSPTDTTRALVSLEVEATSSFGPTYSGAFAYEIVYNQLLDINQFSREEGSEVLFKCVNVGSRPGFPVWRFRTWKERLSVSTAVFTKAGGNLIDARLVYDYKDEVTKAVVGGKGKEDARTVRRVSNDARIARTPNNWRHIERFHSLSNVSDTTKLDDAGKAQLGKYRAKARLEGTITDTQKSRFGIDWGLGSLVTIQDYGVSVQALVRSVRIRVKGNQSSVEAQVGADL